MERYGIEGGYFQYAAGNPIIQDVDFLMQRGEVHGLVGENGAGKSTLIDLLTGSLMLQRGNVVADEAPASIHSLRDAQALGVAVVQQHYNVFPELSVVDNIMCVGHGVPRSGFLRQFDRRAAGREVRDLLAGLDISIDPGRKLRSLDAAERKMIEVARAVRLGPSFLILDEPTAALEPSSSRVVLDLIMRLRSRGIGVCFVSHRLDEVLATADQVTVLRNGRRVACEAAKDLDVGRLASLMVGETESKSSFEVPEASTPAASGAPASIRLRDVHVAVGAQPVSIEIRRGEILGLVGLLGSGTSRLVRMIGGAEPLVGAMTVDGNPSTVRTPRQAQRVGIGFIPENRKEEGFFPELSVADNIAMARLGTSRMFGKLRARGVKRVAKEWAEKLDIRVPSLGLPARVLSGGNLQKVLIAKWMTSGMTILAIDEPTHGVDIGGKGRIHSILQAFARQGGTVVVSLSESQEAIQLCDRVAIMRHGEVVALLGTESLSQGEITELGAAAGVREIEALLDGADEAMQP
jgi:ABC-type sugar transport system ATPase subunit